MINKLILGTAQLGLKYGITNNNDKPKNNPYEIEVNGEKEDLSWLVG